jgi:hypothetical protein
MVVHSPPDPFYPASRAFHHAPHRGRSGRPLQAHGRHLERGTRRNRPEHLSAWRPLPAVAPEVQNSLVPGKRNLCEAAVLSSIECFAMAVAEIPLGKWSAEYRIGRRAIGRDREGHCQCGSKRRSRSCHARSDGSWAIPERAPLISGPRTGYSYEIRRNLSHDAYDQGIAIPMIFGRWCDRPSVLAFTNPFWPPLQSRDAVSKPNVSLCI